MLWRRSFDVAPPPIADDDQWSQVGDPRYDGLGDDMPRTECLKDVIARMLPYWESDITADLRAGNRVLVAAHATLTTRGHPILPPRYGRTVDGPIVLEDDVWVGAAAVVLPGVTIGRGSIVGAGAVVTRDVPANTIVGGVPGRPIRGTSDVKTSEARSQ